MKRHHIAKLSGALVTTTPTWFPFTTDSRETPIPTEVLNLLTLQCQLSAIAGGATALGRYLSGGDGTVTYKKYSLPASSAFEIDATTATLGVLFVQYAPAALCTNSVYGQVSGIFLYTDVGTATVSAQLHYETDVG